MKIRTFSKLLAAFVLLPTITYGAIAFQNYEGIVVPQFRKYPNYGFFWGFELGFNHVSSFDLKPKGTQTKIDTQTADQTTTENDGTTTTETTTTVDIQTETVFDTGDLPDIAINLKNGFMAAIVTGYRNKNFRWEAELAGRFNSLESVIFEDDEGLDVESDGQVIVGSLMINLYWDYLLGSYFVPIIGAGVGGAYISNTSTATILGMVPDGLVSDTPDISNSNFGLAWQVMIGGALILNDHAEIGITYRFFQVKPNKYQTQSYAVCTDVDQMPPLGPGDCQLSSDIIDTEFKPTYTAQTLTIEFRNTP